MSNIFHPTALVSDQAKIGENVTVGAYSIIEDEVVIGNNCKIDSHVIIKNGTSLGNNNIIYPFCILGTDCQDQKYDPLIKTRLIIGSNNTFREYVNIHRGSSHDRLETTIGNKNMFMIGVHIAHDCELGNNLIVTNQVALAGHVHIGDWVVLGGYSTVHQFCTIGSHAMVGQASAVSMDVPAFMLVSGNRARAYGINKLGMKRRGFSSEEISQIHHAFRITYRGSLNNKLLIERIKTECKSNRATDILITSIASLRRGIIKRRMNIASSSCLNNGIDDASN